HREKVVMLGENVAPVLFPEGHPIGKDVMIDGSPFMVVGVVEKPKGGFGMGDEDRRVLIPFSTFRKVYPYADELNMRIQAQAGMLNQMVDQAREVLERRRNVPYGGKDNFSIETAEQQVQEFHNIMLMTYVVMIVLSAIGLLIGGVRSEEHTSELQSPCNLVCRLLLEKKKKNKKKKYIINKHKARHLIYLQNTCRTTV